MVEAPHNVSEGLDRVLWGELSPQGQVAAAGGYGTHMSAFDVASCSSGCAVS